MGNTIKPGLDGVPDGTETVQPARQIVAPKLSSGVAQRARRPKKSISLTAVVLLVIAVPILFGYCISESRKTPMAPRDNATVTLPATRHEFLAMEQAKSDAAHVAIIWRIAEPDTLIIAAGRNLTQATQAGQAFLGKLETLHEHYQFNTFVFLAANRDACLANISDRDPQDHTWTLHCATADQIADGY